MRSPPRPSSTAGFREINRNILVVVIAAVVVLPVLYGVAVLTSTNPTPSGLGSIPEVTSSTVEADVVLYAPFNGTTVSVVATVSANQSAPLVETLAAQYRPTGNGSTAVFSSYYGTFDAAVVNVTDQSQGVNVTLTVTYGGITGSGNASVIVDAGTVVIPIVMGTAPQLPAENITDSNGATDCPALGGSWNTEDDTCTVDVPTVVTSLTISNGVTVLVDVYIIDTGIYTEHSDATPAFTNYGTLVNNAFMSAGLDNYGLYVNGGLSFLSNSFGGVITNYATGTFNNLGWIDNGFAGGTINNYGTFDNGFRAIDGTNYVANAQIKNGWSFGVINNYGTFNNGLASTSSGIESTSGGVINNYATGTINNERSSTIASTFSSIINNYGTINNNGGTIYNALGFGTGTINNYAGGTINNGGTIWNASGLVGARIYNYGTINNGGTIYTLRDGIIGNSPIGGGRIVYSGYG